jgi:transposase InsO family protein
MAAHKARLAAAHASSAAPADKPEAELRALRAAEIAAEAGVSQLSALEPAEPDDAMSARTLASLSIRYQEARTHRLRRTSHHGTTTWRGQLSPWHRLGFRSCLHRRCLAGRLRAGYCPTSAKRVLSSSLRRRCLFHQARYRIERVMTDNGSCYRSKTFQAACKRLSLR